MSSGRVRRPAVAGSFYPEDPRDLERSVREQLAAARPPAPGTPRPKALIVPHAGYVYSGPVAATAYAALGPLRDAIQRVVLLGPSHHVPLRGLAVPDAEAFATPLGVVELDAEGVARALTLREVRRLGAAHEWEHSLEVQLPFLQLALGSFRLVPLAVGDARDDEVAEVLEALWGGPETLVLVSSDLSHYHDYATARRLDDATSRAILALRPAALGPDSACGRVAVRGLLVAARRLGLHAELLDLRSSGDTAGPRDRVVGYGAFAFASA
jgi:AmmeMemoRadiSam system protein B